jgi:hypothetical protein
MPAVHLQPRFLEDAGSGGISATAIGLIVGIGLVPAIILIWVVIFLFFAYPNDRNFCCMKRRKGQGTSEKKATRASTLSSAETLYENEKGVYDLPKRPFPTHARTESGGSSRSGRLSKVDPKRPATGASKTDTRMSLQSVGSGSTVYGVQESRTWV